MGLYMPHGSLVLDSFPGLHALMYAVVLKLLLVHGLQPNRRLNYMAM